MNDEHEKVIYLRDHSKVQKRRSRRFKLLNILLVGAILLFGYTIVQQEIKLHRIKDDTKELSAYHAQLQDEQKLLQAKIDDANSDEAVKAQARDTLGWVQENDVKLVDRNKKQSE